MLVSELLNHKKGKPVYTVRPSAHVSEAVSLFKEKKIGALVVCEINGDIIGILSERDVMHELADHGADTFDHRIETVMQHKIHSCSPGDGIKHVMNLMAHTFVRHVPVVVDGELRGIISVGDIMKSLLDETQLEVDTLRDYARIH